MPLTVPKIDDRSYQELLDEALARIKVHNPEWTNYNHSDPGVTLIQLFAFLTESLLYRCNQIPERNRKKFLALLGVPLRPAASARGIVALRNERGPLETISLGGGLELRAEQVPFRTELGLDVLPIDTRVVYKRELPAPDPQVVSTYRQLYASFLSQPRPADPLLYETVTVPPAAAGDQPIDLAQAVDRSVWIALLARPIDKPFAGGSDGGGIERARRAIGGKTLSLGVVPYLEEAAVRLTPGGPPDPQAAPQFRFEMPRVPASGGLPPGRTPEYRALDARATSDVLTEPGVVQIKLPPAAEMTLWNDLEPLEQGTSEFPPALGDTTLSQRLITWLRVRAPTAVPARLLWLGANAAMVSQRARVTDEPLGKGNGEPDQELRLARTPVVTGSVRLSVTTAGGETQAWQEVDDLLAAGPEVPAPDQRRPPAAAAKRTQPSRVYVLDPESGTIRFGDGLRGTRPPLDAILRATYDHGVGRAGNVGAGAITSAPALPAGLRAFNPVRTWGGADAETVRDGERQIARYLQHRDRLVSAADFETIALRVPGVEIGRVEVLAAFDPVLEGGEPGDAPGAVTLMIVPKHDPARPDAPLPDRLFLETIAAHLEPRRLVTTELFLRPPRYRDLFVSVGIDVLGGVLSVAEVREAVKNALLAFLAPLPAGPDGRLGAASSSAATQLDVLTAAVTTPEDAAGRKGWPLHKPVVALELQAVAARVPGVKLVSGVRLALGQGEPVGEIAMRGLDLPRVAGISVVAGEPLDLDLLRGRSGGGAVADGTETQGEPGQLPPPGRVPVPVIAEEC